MIPKPLRYLIVVSIVLALIPPAIIARMRAVPSEQPRIHYIQDMDNQHRLEPQHASPEFGGVPLFADGRAMRPLVPGTVARGELGEDEHFERGLAGGGWAEMFPARITFDATLLRRGQERFGIYCAPCHGLAGFGDGAINVRANHLLTTPAMSNGTTWVAPKNLHEEAIRTQPVGQTFNSITNGVRNMAGYAAQVPTADRWAIVAYVKALQRSQHALDKDVSHIVDLPEFEVQVPAPVDAEGESQP